MQFGNAPLIELIAELRWGTAAIVAPLGAASGMVPAPISASTRHEELFMRFGARVASEGYGRFERVVPAGFPLMSFQPVYRYRKNTSEEGTTLYQLGVGLFSANITPPYKTWEAFRPIVEKGVAMLLECRDEAEKASPFSMASLRYIDAFKADLTQGRSAVAFLSEVLGFAVKVPKAIESEADPSTPINLVLQFSIPLKSGLVMNLNAGEGMVDGQLAVITDTSVLTPKELTADLTAVMAAFESAHDVIRATFLGITQKIAHLMVPKCGGAK